MYSSAMPADELPAPAQPETRRQRLRRELVAEVILVARKQLEEGGRDAVSWRGISREIGMNPASLYTYFDSLDEIFTAVITDSFLRLGQAVQTSTGAVDADPKAILIAGSQAYRQWALAHPSEFNLIFTNQIPGYEAPSDGPTVQAQTAIFAPMVAAAAQMAGLDADFDPLAMSLAEELVLVPLWANMHGMVSLEINNHLPFVSDADALFLAAMTEAIDSLG